MELSEINYDCIHFRGNMPCLPNKLAGKVCNNCDQYEKPSRSILLIKLGAIGDIIRTTPLIVRLEQMYPGCHITWITDFPEILPERRVHRIWKFDFKTRFLLKQQRFDISINLEKDYEACALQQEIIAQQKYGFTLEDGHIAVCTPAAGPKLLTGLFDSLSKENRKSYCEEIFEICHLNYQKEPYLLDVSEEYREKWKTILREKGKERTVIGINTGCGRRWPTRLWPEQHYAELIAGLQNKGFFAVLLGGKEEAEKNSRLCSISGAFNPGVVSLKEFIALADNTDLIFSVVTMTMHIAIALKKPLVLLNNIFNRHEFDLFGRGEIIEPETGCDCYYGTSCKRERHCMNDISPESVLEAIIKHAPKR